jgi:hypothetical protein
VATPARSRFQDFRFSLGGIPALLPELMVGRTKGTNFIEKSAFITVDKVLGS